MPFHTCKCLITIALESTASGYCKQGLQHRYTFNRSRTFSRQKLTRFRSPKTAMKNSKYCISLHIGQQTAYECHVPRSIGRIALSYNRSSTVIFIEAQATMLGERNQLGLNDKGPVTFYVNVGTASGG